MGKFQRNEVDIKGIQWYKSMKGNIDQKGLNGVGKGEKGKSGNMENGKWQ